MYKNHGEPERASKLIESTLFFQRSQHADVFSIVNIERDILPWFNAVGGGEKVIHVSYIVYDENY